LFSLCYAILLALFNINGHVTPTERPAIQRFVREKAASTGQRLEVYDSRN